jgi:hypothetical protein
VTSTASKVSIQAKKGDVWALTPVKGKKDTYTIRAVSFGINADKSVVFRYYFFTILASAPPSSIPASPSTSKNLMFSLPKSVLKVTRTLFDYSIFYLFAELSQIWLPQVPGRLSYLQ